MGQGTSRPDKEFFQDLPENERYFGFENFGNTCYCNSVLQALYFSPPFRQRVLEYAAQLSSRSDAKESILTCLAELFAQINTQRKKSGYLSPRKFVFKVKAENELFSGYMHQDAHEFLNFLLNDVSETLAREMKFKAAAQLTNNNHSKSTKAALPPLTGGGIHSRTPSLQALHKQQWQGAGNGSSSSSSAANGPILTWVDELFQGKLVNEMRCLRCDSVTSREEPFYDLSLEIEQNCSVTACLKRFSSTETLDGADKFSCDKCCCKQEAQKRMRVASLPPVLCLHLKRFKYVESAGQMQKLSHRVVFPFHLKLTNTTDTCPDADVEYSLTAVVVHMGAHMNHGHYVALVKSAGRWLCFDDEAVHGVTEEQVQSTFGHTQQPLMRADGGGNQGNASNSHVDHAYILFYERQEGGGNSGSGGGSGGGRGREAVVVPTTLIPS